VFFVSFVDQKGIAMLDTFYSTSSQICFVLLGLWWVVVQFKYDLFVREPQRRRTAYNISLYFILPGAMSLLSLLANDLTILWRVAFFAAAAIGAFETAQMLRTKTDVALPVFGRGANIGALVIYLLIALFALVPDLLRAIGITPLLVEGALLALLIFLGVHFAWTFFMQVSSK
jgi:hypothetical protein